MPVVTIVAGQRHYDERLLLRDQRNCVLRSTNVYNAVPTADDLHGPIGPLACGFASAYVGQQATTALNQGKCIGMRALIYVPMSTTHLVIEPC